MDIKGSQAEREMLYKQTEERKQLTGKEKEIFIEKYMWNDCTQLQMNCHFICGNFAFFLFSQTTYFPKVAMGRGNGAFVFMETEFQFGMTKKILTMKGNDDCTMM